MSTYTHPHSHHRRIVKINIHTPLRARTALSFKIKTVRAFSAIRLSHHTTIDRTSPSAHPLQQRVCACV